MRRFLVLSLWVACHPSAHPAPVPEERGLASRPVQVGLRSVRSGPPPAASADALDQADAAVEPSATSPSCAPPQLEQREPPLAAHTLEGLVQLVRNQSCTALHIERDFGKLRPAPNSTRAYELMTPVPDVSRVKINWVHTQNREYLPSFELDFAAPAQPTVLALATRLGVQAQVGHRRPENDCFDASCPSVSFSDQGGAVAFTFYVSDGTEQLSSASRPDIYSSDVQKLLVERLYIPTNACTPGRLQPVPTPLPEASAGRPHDLLAAVQEAARELTKTPHDDERIKRLLDGFGSVDVQDNTVSTFTGIRLFLEKERPIAPFCFAGFRYLRKREQLCRIWGTENHVYEADGNSTHRLFLKVALGSVGMSGPSAARIEMLQLILQPRAWPELSFQSRTK